MKPWWKMHSGEFAGWRSKNNGLYNPEGTHIGYFDQKDAYSLQGEYIGQMEGDKWLGKKIGKARPGRVPKTARSPITKKPLPDRRGRSQGGWVDPSF